MVKKRLLAGLVLLLLLSSLVLAAHVPVEECGFWCKLGKFLAPEGKAVVGEA